jgi:hypothetical protein
MAFWRKSTNTPTFTNGVEHWALTPHGLVTRAGPSIDPPPDAFPGRGQGDRETMRFLCEQGRIAAETGICQALTDSPPRHCAAAVVPAGYPRVYPAREWTTRVPRT